MPNLRKLSIDERIALCQQALKINKEKEWGCLRISKIIGVSMSTVNNWIHGHSIPKKTDSRVELGCSYCGKLIKRWPFQVKKQSNFFCCVGCHAKWMSENIGGKKHPAYMPRVARICEECGAVFMVPQWRVRRDHGSRFCNHECYAIWVSKNKNGTNHNNWKERKRKCEYCGNIINYPPSVTRRFCSTGCAGAWYSEHLSGPNSPIWRGGTSGKYSERGLNWPIQKKFALKRDDYTCQKCGSKKMLHVHHMIPFRKFKDYRKANKLSNLIVLCKSCHSHLGLTETYDGRW